MAPPPPPPRTPRRFLPVPPPPPADQPTDSHHPPRQRRPIRITTPRPLSQIPLLSTSSSSSQFRYTPRFSLNHTPRYSSPSTPFPVLPPSTQRFSNRSTSNREDIIDPSSSSPPTPHDSQRIRDQTPSSGTILPTTEPVEQDNDSTNSLSDSEFEDLTRVRPVKRRRRLSPAQSAHSKSPTPPFVRSSPPAPASSTSSASDDNDHGNDDNSDSPSASPSPSITRPSLPTTITTTPTPIHKPRSRFLLPPVTHHDEPRDLSGIQALFSPPNRKGGKVYVAGGLAEVVRAWVMQVSTPVVGKIAFRKGRLNEIAGRMDGVVEGEGEEFDSDRVRAGRGGRDVVRRMRVVKHRGGGGGITVMEGCEQSRARRVMLLGHGHGSRGVTRRELRGVVVLKSPLFWEMDLEVGSRGGIGEDAGEGRYTNGVVGGKVEEEGGKKGDEHGYEGSGDGDARMEVGRGQMRNLERWTVAADWWFVPDTS